MTSFDLDLTKYNLGWSDEVEYAFDPVKGINEGVVDQISWWKGEPRWMTQLRKRSLRQFDRKPMAEWFATNMPDLDFQDIYYYLKPSGEQVDEWDELPEQMKVDVREARHPRSRAQVPRRRHGAVRVGSRVPQEPRGSRRAGNPVLRHGHRAARVPRPRQAVLRHDHPARRQQVRGAQLVGLVGRHRSSTSRRASTARCRCRPTSGSTPRTPASSSAR